MKQHRPSRHIVALGGGGFSMEPECRLLDDFVLSLAGRALPRVCFVPTASGDAEGYVDRFYGAFGGGRAEASHLALFRRNVCDIREYLLDQDVIYVGGGNTANLLVVWRLHGVDQVLREAWGRGIILAGLSAGMICWFAGGATDSFGPLAALRDGLGFLPGSACPHFDGEAERRPAYRRMIAAGQLEAGVAADDGVALHYRGTELAEAVTSRPDAKAYRLTNTTQGVSESPIPTRYLGVD